jgi:thiamine monophosphate synthase
MAPTADASVLVAALSQWARVAQAKGADSLLLRQPDWPVALQHAVLRHLHPTTQALGVPLLLSSPTATTGLAADGLYLHRAAPHPAPNVWQAYRYWGRACHSRVALEAAAHAGGYAFATLSPIFATPTHPEAVPLGLAYLQASTQALPGLPILALGGIAPDNHEQCLQAGAAGIAAIRLFA